MACAAFWSRAHRHQAAFERRGPRRWYDISHTQGRLTDPSFSEYLSTTLSTLTLEGPLFGAFEKLMMHFAHLVEGRPVSEELTREIERLRGALLVARAPENAWSETRSMVSERGVRMWSTRDVGRFAQRRGLERMPRHVVVGLLSSRLTSRTRSTP